MARKTRKVRKTLRPRQGGPGGATGIPGAATKTASTECELDLGAFREEIIAGVRRLAGSRSLRDILHNGPE